MAPAQACQASRRRTGRHLGPRRLYEMVTRVRIIKTDDTTGTIVVIVALG
jgi:hypothetical protein